ncbi:hypothetical protein OG223_45235 [Streptomyces sp. NBC_01478]|uniref:hypothetical protein n=1 Tax=Streptomyces sp. NBC_01478 TaxID=2903882 RepID=UPI002E3614B4|nr:hypothetical protein [Streptomyces sp. NBC_01478]
MTTMTPTAIAVDPGARHTRIAHLAADGTPTLADLPGTVPGEGLPTAAGAGGHHGAALRSAYTVYRERYGTPEQVVVVVPQHDRAEHARRATDVLTALHGTDPLPRLRALGTPHAVLALLRHAGTATGTRYTVCDLGATAAEVSGCALAPGTVAVTGSARHAPADGFGAGLDRALLTAVGLPDDEDGWVALAAARAEDGAARRLDLALEQSARHPGRYDGIMVHRVGGRDLGVGAVRQALERLTTGLDSVLDTRPGTPVVTVGGGARFAPLVRHVTNRQGTPVELPEGTDPALAAAFGAALVAAGRIDPADRYPYAVLVDTHRTAGGAPRAEELLICPAGALEPGGATVFAQSEGRPVRIRTRPVGASAVRPVHVHVRAARDGRPVPVGTLRIPAAEGARFHVGVRLAVDGEALLVLHPLGSGTPWEYPLGALPTDIEGARS